MEEQIKAGGTDEGQTLGRIYFAPGYYAANVAALTATAYRSSMMAGVQRGIPPTSHSKATSVVAVVLDSVGGARTASSRSI